MKRLIRSILPNIPNATDRITKKNQIWRTQDKHVHNSLKCDPGLRSLIRIGLAVLHTTLAHSFMVSQRALHDSLLFSFSPVLDYEVNPFGSLVGSTITSSAEFGRFAIFFLSFLLGKSLSLPAMILPGCTMLNNTSATSIGNESRQY